MTDLVPENPIEATPPAPGEVTVPKPSTGVVITSTPEPVSPPSEPVIVPVSVATEKLTEEHKATFWEIAKTDLSEALEWLNKEISKL